jgi:two-component system response regulator HydG
MRYHHSPLNPIVKIGDSAHSLTIRQFLVLAGTALVALIFLGTIIFAYRSATFFLDDAYSRNSRLRAMAQAHQVSNLLVEARYELEFLSHGSLTVDSVTSYIQAKPLNIRKRYKEFAFYGRTISESFIIINHDSSIYSVDIENIFAKKNNIFSETSQVMAKEPEYVYVSDPIEAIYPAIDLTKSIHGYEFYVIRFAKNIYDKQNNYKGRVILSLDLIEIRDILSLYTSTQSPLYLSPQDDKQKKSFFFDSSGWILLQSEFDFHNKKNISIDIIRRNIPGDVGRPDFTIAFRPALSMRLYWNMVADVQRGEGGQTLINRPFFAPSGSDRELYLSYVPISFRESENSTRTIGGIGCIDTSFSFLSSTYKIAGILSVCFVTGIVLISVAMLFVSNFIRKQVNELARHTENKIEESEMSPINIKKLYFEFYNLQGKINLLLTHLQSARHNFAASELMITNEQMNAPVNLDMEINNNPELNPKYAKYPLHGIIGAGAEAEKLRQQIEKASSILADILIIGETGTGKELVAEAIHSLSNRSDGPFISINCGAIDENLLMDALFGHVKGAFSGAEDERKGAFLSASGGTLHLDEIGNASTKVQQSLLRALSVRRIRPIGSDQDFYFDARVIAATNVDLKKDVTDGNFREDLYYRLAVIKINTPSLRERKEDIPLLLRHFIEEYKTKNNTHDIKISRGFLSKIMNYDWPGNIRELRNCLIRSITFTEGDILLEKNLLFESESAPQYQKEKRNYSINSYKEKNEEPQSDTDTASEIYTDHPESVLSGLNLRQQKAWPIIVGNGLINRSEYQEIVGETISVRTAQYDLRDLVARGLLEKRGRGPSCRYHVVFPASQENAHRH